MAYSRLNKVDGEIFNASDVTHMEDGIVQNESDISTKADQTEVDKNAEAITQLNEDLSDINITSASGKTISNGDDLNDYETPGKYYSSSSTITNSLLNCPETGSGITLFVFQMMHQNRRMQFLVNPYNNRFWLRASKDTAEWNEWVRIADNADFTQLNTSLTDLTSSVTLIEQEIDAIKEQIGMNTTSWPEISTKSTDDEEVTMGEAEDIVGDDNE